MLIRIDPSSGIPITRQIMDQIRSRCASQSLKPNDRLPSVRELARQLAVNQNTILRAYERLTAEGLLEMRHGEGTFVATFAPAKHLKQEKTALQEDATRLIRRAASLNLTPADIRDIIESTIEKVMPKEPQPGGKK